MMVFFFKSDLTKQWKHTDFHCLDITRRLLAMPSGAVLSCFRSRDGQVPFRILNLLLYIRVFLLPLVAMGID